MYFVVECSTMSAPSVSGCCSAGEAKVLSTNTFAELFRAEFGDCGDVGDRQQRVGGRFHPDQPGLRGDRRADRVEIGQRDRGVLHTPLGEDLVDQPERSAVGVVGDDHMITGAQQRTQHAVAGRHAGAERAAESALFDGGQRGFQRGPGRVAGAGVLESAAQTADAVLGEGAAGVDRGIDRAGRRVGPVAGVNGLGGQSGSLRDRAVCRSSTTSLAIAVDGRPERAERRTIGPIRPMRMGLPESRITGYEANIRRAGDGRVAVGRCRGGGRRGCRPSPSRSGAAVVAGLSPRPPGGPLSLVPRRSPGADRQPAGGPGPLGRECVSHLLVRRRRGQRRPDHLGGRCAATAAPTGNRA